MSIVSLPHTRLGNGAPLIVFPGLSGRHGIPDRLIGWIQRQEIAGFASQRSVWSIDRRRGLEPGITMEHLADEYARVVKEHFASPVDVIGISTGGSIALQLAVDHPELVDKLVLVSSAHRLSEHGRQTQRDIATLLRSGHPRRAASLFLSTTASSRLAAAALAAVGALAPRMVVGRDDLDLLATLDAEDSFNLLSRLDSIRQPVLVAGGERDRFYTAELFAETSAALPNSTLRVFPRAGHIGIAGNRRLSREILEFLRA